MTSWLVVGSVIAAGLVVCAGFLLAKKAPLPPLPFLTAGRAKRSPQEDTALLELAREAVGRYPELGPSPAELLAQIHSYCDRAKAPPGRTARLILEKMLGSPSLRQAMSFWQVKGFLDHRDHLKGSGGP